MTTKEIKKQADKKINETVKVPILKSNMIALIDLVILKNKIVNGIVLTSFKDTTFVCNALLYLSKYPYEILTNTTED